MNNEEKLEKAIKKMQGFSTFHIVATYQDLNNRYNPTTVIDCMLDAENPTTAAAVFTTTHPEFRIGTITLINEDKKDEIIQFEFFQ